MGFTFHLYVDSKFKLEFYFLITVTVVVVAVELGKLCLGLFLLSLSHLHNILCKL